MTIWDETVKGPENRQEFVQTWLRRKGLFKEKGFEFRVKLMRGQGKWRSRINSSDEWWRRRSGCSSCLCREFKSTGAWLVKTYQLLWDVSELTDVGEWASSTVRLNIDMRRLNYRAVQWHCAKRAEAHFRAEAPESSGNFSSIVDK